MRKPPFVSHFLVLRDLIQDIDVRRYSDTVEYLTSRIENIKCDLVKRGLEFEEENRETKYSFYKPYRLIRTAKNMALAEELLEEYYTEKVEAFLEANYRLQKEVKKPFKVEKNTPYNKYQGSLNPME